jgi:hypothetical protein
MWPTLSTFGAAFEMDNPAVFNCVHAVLVRSIYDDIRAGGS